ncbi:inorganic diphosphatase [Streptococcus equinus]|uniref:inorganic diphosphatase n=1 Tax=Streptococcus equinus TaxID=1335 RepID=UPI001FB240E2|nr:inorganic diphosphatase [Streptococcus equinus]UOC12058.1 inorganic diphosphatase [Streptococcus equinus]
MRQSYTAVIDRPIGYQDRYGNNYPINYGYIPNLLGGDGVWQDVYVISEQVSTPLEVFEGELVAIIHRADDVETKWILTSPGEEVSYERIKQATRFLEQYFKSTIELL